MGYTGKIYETFRDLGKDKASILAEFNEDLFIKLKFLALNVDSMYN